MNDLPEQVQRFIRTRGLFRCGQPILVAVSGGLDSMVLLHLLHSLASDYGWRLTAAHFNHRLRGRSSDADERLVVRAAKRLRLPVVVGRADVQAISRAGKLSMEMAARKARHDFLARTARRLHIRSIALAHHADDQVELFFLRLFRGSGGEGLSGMKGRNCSPVDSKLELLRPLLGQSKEALLEYATANRIRFREDASNARLDIRRNRIRHELLPWLRRNYQPALDRTVLRSMDILGADAEFVSQSAAEWLTRQRRPPFEQLPVALQRRCIQLELLRLNVAPDYELVECLRIRPGKPVTVSPHVVVARDPRGAVRLRQATSVKARRAVVEVDLQHDSGELVFNSLRIHWKLARRKDVSLPNPAPGLETFDADLIGPHIMLRHWRPGDRFQPIGLRAPVKLQNLFTNHKIPRVQRHDLVIATTAAGELFWVEKLRISERFKLSKATTRRLQWRWNRL